MILDCWETPAVLMPVSYAQRPCAGVVLNLCAFVRVRCVCVCLHVYALCMCVCMYVFAVCLHVCMYVCICMFIYVCVMCVVFCTCVLPVCAYVSIYVENIQTILLSLSTLQASYVLSQDAVLDQSQPRVLKFIYASHTNGLKN